MGFPCGSSGKESACYAGDLGLISSVGRSPGEGKGHLFQYSGLENSMHCPWGCKELDMTERLSLYYNYICSLCFSVFFGGLILFVTICLFLCLFVSCLIPPLNDKPWMFFGKNDAKAEAPVLWPPHVKS